MDTITEVGDDLADVGKDAQTFNGNRFLVALLGLGVALFTLSAWLYQKQAR